MGTEITRPDGFALLSEEQQDQHMKRVGVRARSILSGFWENADSDAARAMEVEAWVDVLGKLPHSEIRAAWAEYQKTGPRTQAGRLYRPDAGALYRIIMRERVKARERARLDAMNANMPEDLRDE